MMRLLSLPKIATFFTVLTVLAFLLMNAPQVAADLPPRPTPVTKTVTAPMIRGGFIELNAGTTGAGQATIVQWQTAAGDWVDVSTWLGHAEPDGSKRWWVAPDDLSTGPFRWQVLGQDGTPLMSSEPFLMPTNHGEVVVSTIDLEN